jgi:hypothetical protein
MTLTIEEVLERTDWAELSRQKLALLEVCKDQPEHPLTGLLHFLDAVQDAAYADGYPVVFLTTEEGSE